LEIDIEEPKYDENGDFIIDDEMDEEDMPDHFDGIFNAALLNYDDWEEEIRRE